MRAAPPCAIDIPRAVPGPCPESTMGRCVPRRRGDCQWRGALPISVDTNNQKSIRGRYPHEHVSRVRSRYAHDWHALLVHEARAAEFVFDTASGNVLVDGTASSAVHGTPFTTFLGAEGTRVWRFAGDLNFAAGDVLTATGNLGVTLHALNNVTIDPLARISVSAGTQWGAGGGAGGTIKFLASSVETGATTVIDTQGGLGAANNGGGDGRFLIAGNAATGTGLVLNGTRQKNYLGLVESQWGASNPFQSHGRLTPFIPDLASGAEIFGLLDSALVDALHGAFDGLRAVANGARGAVLRMDIGPGAYGFGFLGFDMLLYLNLTDLAIDDPMLGVVVDGIGESNHLRALAAGGVFNVAPGVITDLGAFDVWATLIPESAALTVNATGFVNGRALDEVSGLALANGEFALLTTAPVPLPAGGLLLASAAAMLLGRARRRAMHRIGA